MATASSSSGPRKNIEVVVLIDDEENVVSRDDTIIANNDNVEDMVVIKNDEVKDKKPICKHRRYRNRGSEENQYAKPRLGRLYRNVRLITYIGLYNTFPLL